MIYVRRNPALIPERVLRVAERAQAELEALPPEDRVAFIKKKAHVWTGFKKYLAKMSYGKCWYSESKPAQSFFDVDHFRPKAEAQRDDAGNSDDGYPWLAFDWDNFRYSAGRSNRLSTDEVTDLTVGKGSWFPLCTGSPIADWATRDISVERPMLLDPTNQHDMGLIRVGANGQIEPSEICVGTNRERVSRSAICYGLNLPLLTDARSLVMREIGTMVEILIQIVEAANAAPPVADQLPIVVQADLIKSKTMSNSEYALAARSRLIELGMAYLIAGPEDFLNPAV